MAGTPKREGPDWADIGAFLRAIDQHHGTTTSVAIVADGALYSSALAVVVTMGAPQLVDVAQTWRQEFRGVFPCVQHRTLEGLVYNLLHRADAEAGRQLWKQNGLPF